jgi:hypothetical protein
MSELSPEAKKQMNERLKKSNSVQEAFDILGEYYELENLKLGIVTKGVLILKLQKIAHDLKAQPRPQHTRKESKPRYYF